MKEIYLLFCLAFIILTGCESLEDTYSDYAGDGPVRYAGKCTDVKVVSGWNRLTVTWKNSLDPNIVNNKISCSSEEYEFDTIVPANVSECNIRGLRDGAYSVTVTALLEDGGVSLSEPVFGRPYTYAHEAVCSFTQGISKHFFVGNNLVLFYNNWDENIISIKLKYTPIGESVAVIKELGRDEFAKKYALVKGVDVSQPVVLLRTGILTDCPDEIDFEPIVLTKDVVMQVDFKNALRERYGETDFGEVFLSRTELELDYDLASLEDILYFSNLKKLVLGKNRYLPNLTNTAVSFLISQEKSLFCIQVAKEILNLEVECYGNNYFQSGTEGIIDMGLPVWPLAFELLATKGWSVNNSSPDLAPAFSSEDLLDDNASTAWEPFASTDGLRRTFDLTIDMNALQVVDGLKIVQAANTKMFYFLPKSIVVRVSQDGQKWENPMFVEDNTLGAASGEATCLRFKETYNIRYVKISIADRSYSTSTSTTLNTILGDVIPYRVK